MFTVLEGLFIKYVIEDISISFIHLHGYFEGLKDMITTIYSAKTDCLGKIDGFKQI